MGPSDRCYIQRFVEIGPLVPEKIVGRGFNHIHMYGRGGHLGYVTQMLILGELIIIYFVIYLAYT